MRWQSKQKNKFQMTQRCGKWLVALQQQPASKDFPPISRSQLQMHFDQHYSG